MMLLKVIIEIRFKSIFILAKVALKLCFMLFLKVIHTLFHDVVEGGLRDMC